MRYNHISDSIYSNIARGLDRYSSVLFMCNTHLLLSNNGWKDTGITGVLCLVTCRKLKSNAVRIYQGDSFHLLFEFECYEGIVDRSTFGLRYWLVPFVNYCFCFLFEDPNDTTDCSKMIHDMSTYYPMAPQSSDSKGKGFLGSMLRTIQNFRLVEHNDHKVNVEGDKVYDVLYRDALNTTAIKHRSQKEEPSQDSDASLPSHSSHSSSSHPPPLPRTPPPPLHLPPPLPPAKLPSHPDLTIVRSTVDLEEERRRLRSGLPSHFTFDDPSLRSQQRDSLPQDLRRPWPLARSMTRSVGESHSEATRGVSGISDVLEAEPSDFLGKNARGGFCGAEVDERSQRVAEIRQYQQRCRQWDESWQDDGSVLVIDDAEKMLDEETWSPSARASAATVIDESSEEPVELRAASQRPSEQLIHPGEFVGSKESEIIMQDCAAMAENRSEGSYHTPHSTLLPDVVARSHASSASPSRVNNHGL